MELIYLMEINIICIIILVLLLKQLGKKSEDNAMDIVILKDIILTTLALCIFDNIAAIVEGSSSSRIVTIIMYVAVMGKYIALALNGYLWMLYIYVQLKLIKNLRDKNVLIWSIPIIITVIIIIFSPITEFMFSVDEKNIYQRENGVILHWIVLWGYIGISIIQSVRAIIKEENLYKKQKIKPLVYFIIPAIIGSIIQMYISGVASTQIGIVLAILIIVLNMQKNQIVTDMLTGINNRNGLNKFLYNTMTFNEKTMMYVFMIDLNDFKKINDIHGHMIGDRALQEVAEILQKIVSKVKGKCFLSRYGGDEFIIILHECEEKEVEKLDENLLEAFYERNTTTKESYELKISIGKAVGECSNVKDVENLLINADDKMYQYKKEIKKRSNIK